MEGRGQTFGHETHRGDTDALSAAVIAFGYALSDRGEIVDHSGFEQAGEGAVKILVVRGCKSKSVFAHVVPSKGVDEKGFAVGALVEDVKWLGYAKIDS